MFSRLTRKNETQPPRARNNRVMPIHLLLLLILLTSLLVNYFLYRKVKIIHQHLNGLIQTSISKTSPLPSDSLANQRPILNAMVTKSFVDIEGEADANCILCLTQDHQPLAVTLPENGKYSFKKIPVRRGVHEIALKAMTQDGKVQVLQVYHFGWAAPTLEYSARDFVRGDISLRQVALTFDGDYLDNAAAPILETLKTKKINATFFLTGRFMERYPTTLRQIVAEGHEVGNHTWRHPHLTFYPEKHQHETRPEITRELLQQELQRTATLFEKVTRQKMRRLWRAPYGEQNPTIRAWAAELGYRQIGWTTAAKLKLSLDTMDWVTDKSSGIYQRPEEMLKKILQFAAKDEHGLNGGIILMHLGTERKEDFPYLVLGQLIDSLQVRGYQLTTISKMSF
ncbi:polysaccharide deacetylase family protein [candidate division KSB1 bacterium]|nr:polysaccharide deacetylase family protein [candidate division KSB1 bacterium]